MNLACCSVGNTRGCGGKTPLQAICKAVQIALLRVASAISLVMSPTTLMSVFTGKFAFGPRSDCERAVIKLKGICERGVTKRTDYLIIGTFGSRDWVHTSFGRKIEQAVDYRDAGESLAIVAEENWVRALPRG